MKAVDLDPPLIAYLSRPAGDAQQPAVVMMHGCSGLLNPQGRIFGLYQAWARTLVAKGYVALIVDSASPRGFGQTCNEGPQRRYDVARPGEGTPMRAWPFCRNCRSCKATALH